VVLCDPDTRREVRLCVVSRGWSSRRRLRVSCRTGPLPLGSPIRIEISLIGVSLESISPRTRVTGGAAMYRAAGTFDGNRTADPNVVDVRFVRVAPPREEVRALEVNGTQVAFGWRARRVKVTTRLESAAVGAG
jgi:hypothetical protein